MPQVLLLLRIISLMCLLYTFSTPHVAAMAPRMSKPGCPESCANNNITIPYPFGIGKDCYDSPWFEIICNNASKPFLVKLNMEVLNISINYEDSHVMLNSPVFSTCKHGNFWQSSDLLGSPFLFDMDSNVFVVLGCNNILLLNQTDEIIAGCISTCNVDLRSVGTGCYGINCCQTTIASSLSSYYLTASTSSKTNNSTNNDCVDDTKGFLVAYEWFRSRVSDVSSMFELHEAPVQFSWSLSDVCRFPYEGNPHFQGGCRAKEPSMSKPGCPESCANNDITVPYPFGIGKDCYYNSSFEIICNNASKPVLTSVQMEVLNISIKYDDSHVMLNSPVFSTCKHGNFWQSSDLLGSPFLFDMDSNVFVVLGCNNILLLNQTDEIIAGCISTCNVDLRRVKTGCYGINCCQTAIPSSLSSYRLNASTFVKTNNSTNSYCINDTKGFLVAYEWFRSRVSDMLFMYELDEAPVQFSWSPSDVCRFPYEGNPYSLVGCRVIEECAGCKDSCHTAGNGTTFFCRKRSKTTIILGSSLGGGVFCLLFAAFVFWLVKEIRRRREIKLRKKFFKRNGGFLLQQEMSSSNDAIERTKIFTIIELEKATDGFNTNRILGQGGQGTVYKGMLTDGKIVAVKRSKKMDDSQVEQFINEVVILSQINHRNIVQLLGCCLETEVPLLVYEFISNGSLFQLLYNQDEDFPLSWEMRLRIATEVAGALAYIHSSSSCPIYHRDIKSSNILLDDKFRAKIADFGTSRTIAIEQTHLTTLVTGTFGYLDPEYFQSSQFTDKSDVYSFGVVLVELLTGLKPILSTKGQPNLNLSAYFIASAVDGSLENIIDSQVRKEGRKDDIVAIARLARRCLNLTGKHRPTMREITVELEGIRMSHVPSACLDNAESVIEVKEPIYADSSLTLGSSYYDDEGLSYDSYMLMYNR